MKISVYVVAANSEGGREILGVTVDCTKDQYDEGEHYEAASNYAEGLGYEVLASFDGNDRAALVLDRSMFPDAQCIAV